MIKNVLLILLIGVIIIKLSIKMLTIENKYKPGIQNLFIFAFTSIILLGSLIYYLEKEESIKTNKEFNFYRFLNGDIEKKDLLKEIAIGFGTGFIFGMIDNFSLWFGMEALDNVLPGGELTKAALGNTFADTYGTIISTFTLVLISKLLKQEPKLPLWIQAFGVLSGCLAGLVLSRIISGRD